MWVIFPYLVLALITGLTAFASTSASVAISGLISPFLAFGGGSGMRGALYGDKGQRATGIILGVLFFGGALFWVSQTGFYVTIFDITIDGSLWIVIGFGVGFVFTSRKHAAL